MNKYVRYSLLALGLTLGLAACSKDEPTTPSTVENQEAAGQLHISGIDVEGQFAPIESEVIEAPQEARANTLNGKKDNYDFTTGYSPVNSRVVIRVKNASGKYVLDDDGNRTSELNKLGNFDRELTIQQKPSIPMLMILRAPSARNGGASVKYTYVSGQWTWDATKNTYRMKIDATNAPGLAIDYSSEPERIALQKGTVKYEAMVLTGGWSYDQNKKHLALGLSRPLFLSKQENGVIDFPIPYTSGWQKLNYDKNTEQLSLNAPFKLKPYGSLLTLTFRNNSSVNVTMQDVQIYSNTLAYKATVDLSEQGFRQVQGDELKVTNGDAWSTPTYGSTQLPTIYATQFKFSGSSTGPRADLPIAAGEVSDCVLLTWALPQTLSAEAGFKTAGNQPNLGAPQLHVYPTDVELSGSAANLAKQPDYTFAPIMGTDKTFEAGKAYTINCEFYDQPDQPLGYLTKRYVNTDGNSFAPESATGSDIPLVSLKHAVDFLRGKTINGTNYYLMNHAWANLIGYLEPINFTGNTDSYRYGYVTALGSAGGTFQIPGSTQQPNVLPVLKNGVWTTEEFDQIQAVGGVWNSATSRENYAIRHMYRRPDAKANSVRSPYQSIQVVRATGQYGQGELAGNFYLNDYEILSFYVGKYFVGNIYETPVGVGQSRPWMQLATDHGGYAGLWAYITSQFDRKRYVHRKFHSPGHYADVVTDDLNYNRDRPANTTRSEINTRGFYWVRNATLEQRNHREWIQEVLRSNADNSQYGTLLQDFATYTGADDTYYRRIYGYNAFEGRVFMVSRGNEAANANRYKRAHAYWYQMLRPYSTTYQGDK